MAYASHCREVFLCLELLESWDGHQKNLVCGPCLYFVVFMVERNQNCFNRISTANSNIKAKCLITLVSWINLTPVYNPGSFLDFVSSLVL